MLGQKLRRYLYIIKVFQLVQKIIGAGGNDIDHDLAHMYKIELSEARKIKEKFALAHVKNANIHDVYETVNSDNVKIKINQRVASEVVMSRINEILTLAKNELKDLTNKPIQYIHSNLVA